ESSEVADGAEEAQHRVVLTREVEVAHIGFEKGSGWMFFLCRAPGSRIAIPAAHDEAVTGEEPRMLGGAAGHVKDGLAPGIEPAQQRGDLRRFARVVLERRVNEVVELRRCTEHLEASLIDFIIPPEERTSSLRILANLI